jgi:hypothetical protein
VSDLSEGEVAAWAEQPSDAPALVVVVDIETPSFAWPRTADGAAVVLSDEQAFVLGQRDSVEAA